MRIVFFCVKKTKITTLFNNFFSSVSVFDVRSRQYHDPCVCIPLLANCLLCFPGSTSNMHCGTLVNACRRLTWKRTNCWIKSLFLFSLHTKSIFTWTILMMSLLPFWVLNVSVALLSMQGQKALRFHQKYLNLCSEDERRSYEFGTTWEWVINDRILFFGLTIPLKSYQPQTFEW